MSRGPRRNPRRLPDGQWQADMRRFGITPARKRFRTKEAADRALHAARDAMERGVVARDVPTVEEFIPRFTAAVRPRVEASTWESYESILRIHLLPEVGHKRLDHIGVEEQQELIGHLLAKGMSRSMVHRVYATLSVVLMLGARFNLCAVPTKKLLSLPRPDRFEVTPPTITETEAVIAAIRQDYAALVAVCGYEGLRQGEVFALRVSDIDFDHKRIQVRRSLKRGGVIGDTKSHQRRSVPMLGPVEQMLRQHIAEGMNHDDLLFHRDGRPIHAGWFHRDVWSPARDKAGVEFRFHDLRHGSAAVMIQVGGWLPKRVQLALGHSSITVTMDVYGGLWPDDESESRDRLSDALTAAIADAKAQALADPLWQSNGTNHSQPLVRPDVA